MGRGGDIDIRASIPFTRARADHKSAETLKMLETLGEPLGMKPESAHKGTALELGSLPPMQENVYLPHPTFGKTLIQSRRDLAIYWPRLSKETLTSALPGPVDPCVKLTLDFKTGHLWLWRRLNKYGGRINRVYSAHDLGTDITSAVKEANRLTEEMMQVVFASTNSRPKKFIQFAKEYQAELDESGAVGTVQSEKNWFSNNVEAIRDKMPKALERMEIWRRETKIREEMGELAYQADVARGGRAERIAAEAMEKAAAAEQRAARAEASLEQERSRR